MTAYRFMSAEQTILPLDRAKIFFDGQFSTPRLHHPEGIAIGPDGFVWCGDANGRILRIAPDGTAIETVADTGGFVLGLAFDGAGHLFVCEMREAAVLRLTLATGKLERFGTAPIRIPNYPVVDRRRGVLYVSDSYGFGAKAPGVWRFDLATGESSLWWSEPMDFANGMALAGDGTALMVVETFSRLITRIAIGLDGNPQGRSDYAIDLPALPDGIAFDDAGNLFVACYEPSRILRVGPTGRVEVYLDDPTAHAICHPTNIAFKGNTLYSANLGRWHITEIASDTSAVPLVSRPGA
jgi:gluconolactonase